MKNLKGFFSLKKIFGVVNIMINYLPKFIICTNNICRIYIYSPGGIISNF